MSEWLWELQNGQAAPEAVRKRLETMGFLDPQSAARSLGRLMSKEPLRDHFVRLSPFLWAALADGADPDRVLGSFERLLDAAPLAACAFFADHPRVVEILARIFSSSQFLSEILLRNPEYYEDLLDFKRLSTPKSVDQMLREERARLGDVFSGMEALDELRRYQRRELLRIGVCDLLDLFDLPAATSQLSMLADSLVESCLRVVSGNNTLPDGFTVIGMGKLGGMELNYSSDIDFLFLAASTSPQKVKIGEKLIDALARVTTEGFLYRVDMRLRPWGKVGPLVSSPDGYVTYLARHALLWEKQALLKARVVAGDRRTGEDFLRRVKPMLLGSAAESVREDVFAMKQRTEAFIQQKGRAIEDVKLGQGSIRDVEFCVQVLQLTHAADHPEILSPNTLESLRLLAAAGLISSEDRRVLTDGYIFLRTIEHHLQMMDYRQTHALPEDPQAIHSLARRLGFQRGQQFLARFHQHAVAIRRIYMRIMGKMEMKNIPQPTPSAAPGQTPNVDQHRARMSPSYSETFSEADIALHATLAARLNRQRLAAVEGRPLEEQSDTWQVTIVAVDFPGELSLICGLMFVYGLDILGGEVFTYEPASSAGGSLGSKAASGERKLVDVFTVRPVRANEVNAETWQQYQRDLENLLRSVSAGQAREARGELAKRVGASLFAAQHAALPHDAEVDPFVTADEPGEVQAEMTPQLYPVEIVFDNDSSDQYTLLRITAPDTPGFLYEITNALALYRIYIARVTVGAEGSRVQDTLFVTDENGQKISSDARQRELSAATVLIKHFTHLLPHSPNPESALLHFREFIAQLFQRPNWADELASIERPEVLGALARLLGVSDFLWDDFLRMQYANLYPVVRDVSALSTSKTRAQMQAELDELLAVVPGRNADGGGMRLTESPAWHDALNGFKDREMFRIDMRHILRQTTEFWDFASELTDLAEVVIAAAYRLCLADLTAAFGSPLLENGEPSGLSVCALGKCGGRELGFASDIELMFLYAGNGKTSGPQVISTAEFYERLVTAFVRAIRARREGIFEIDLQLRPYGKAGSLAVSVESFRRYFGLQGPAWDYERQALVKLRPLAGDEAMGAQICQLRDAFIYTGAPYNVTAMRAMRERQVRHLVTGGAFNLKYSPGGLVDVEYLIQGMQITYGKDQPALRQTNTREAMAALADAGLLTEADYTRLRKAHTFLRWMIDSLRVVRGNARDITLPGVEGEEFAFLARRMPYGADPARLRDALMSYTRDVQELNLRLMQTLIKAN